MSVHKIFEKYDVNPKDGRLSFDEFKTFKNQPSEDSAAIHEQSMGILKISVASMLARNANVSAGNPLLQSVANAHELDNVLSGDHLLQSVVIDHDGDSIEYDRSKRRSKQSVFLEFWKISRKKEFP